MAKKKSSSKQGKPKASAKSPRRPAAEKEPPANPEAEWEVETDQQQAEREAEQEVEATQPETGEGSEQELAQQQTEAPAAKGRGDLGSLAVSFDNAKPSAQVMAATSEEFRESLQTLQGSLELLISGKVPDARKSRKFLDIAYREAQYLHNRANDLQVASMIETGRLRLKLTALDLPGMLKEIVQRLSPGAAESGLSIELAETQELPPLRGDEGLMHILLSNLIERCVKATPEDGKVEIEVELFEDKLKVNLTSRGQSEPKYSTITVDDTKERGLSVYIADKIAYAHEGQLRLTGEDGEIKAVSLTLPLEVAGRGRGKILVVEDNPQAATLLEYALEGEGYEPLKAMNGLEGLKLARTERVDLVILDILLPGIDGYEVCHQLRSDPKTASIPVIMVSAKAREEDRATALRTGADAYFGKPLSMADLMTAVEKLLEQNQPENWSPA